MAKGYRPVLREQPFLLPPDMREWLPEDHQVWLVIKVVEDHLDTSAFHAARRTGGPGTAGYDPDMLVTLLMWAYANGVTSSRKIEAACWSDVCFRVICAGDAPDHVTIARFRAAFPGAVESLFREVLVLCARLGMGQLGTVALDGTKVAANASKAANRTEETLRKLAAETVAAHAAADAAADELSGGGRRGDEVPPEVVNPATRAARIAAALAELEAEREAAEADRAAQAREYLARLGEGVVGMPPLAAAVEAARARLERARADRAAQIAALQARAGGPLVAGSRRDRPRAGVEDYCRVQAARAALARAEARAGAARRKAAARKGPGPVRNVTDPDSRLMPTRNGFIQGYNAQNMTSEDKLIIAAELTQDTTDTGWFEPMLAAAQDAAALITACQPAPPSAASGSSNDKAIPDDHTSTIGLVLADAGYLSQHNLTVPGPGRLIAVGKHRDLEKTARQATSGQGSASQDTPDGPIAAMAARLATEEGITAYRKRGHIAETPHGQIKHNMGIRRLAMRGKPKAAAEWKFTATVHNLLKAITTGHLTPATLAALTS
ncbi:MAG TPA: transposase [Streptosporangiaceae bacterium]